MNRPENDFEINCRIGCVALRIDLDRIVAPKLDQHRAPSIQLASYFGCAVGQCVGFLGNCWSPMFLKLLVGRPGLNAGTLGVFPECPGTSVDVQICWPDEVHSPPTSADVLSRLNSWLDTWLDKGSFHGPATIQFRGSDGEVFNLRLGEE